MSGQFPNKVTLQALELKLREQPGVKEAVVVSKESNSGEKYLVGCIVPDHNYLDRLFADATEQRRRLQKWQKTFNLSQLGKQPTPEPGFNIGGWNSSYTRKPISAEEMREWVDTTVREIATFRPSEVLEIGCGTGLLLLRLSQGCKRYVGTDFAPEVLKKLKPQMMALGGEWSGVSVLERSAEDFEGFPRNSFDTVIINSVTHYFPSAKYLALVLERAVDVVRPGGRIFVGDVRSMDLLEPYAVSIELFQAAASMNASELRERVKRRVTFEDQLVISPAFFLALQRRVPKIMRVEIKPRRGRFDNELTRFRYNAILHLDSAGLTVEKPDWLPWTDMLTLDAMRERLQTKKDDVLAIQAVANARNEKDVEALTMLRQFEGTAEDLRTVVRDAKARGVNPQDLWSLGQELGYDVDLSWAACAPDGSFDMVFWRGVVEDHSAGPQIGWPQPANVDNDFNRYTTKPGLAVLREILIQQLHDCSAQVLAKDLTALTFVTFDALPRTADGEVDRSALAAPALPG